MDDDLEHRLAAAADALREFELTTGRLMDLDARRQEVSARLNGLRADLAGELDDVARLEGLSLTRVLASLRGARDDALARERAEADAAHYRVRDIEAHLGVVQGEIDAAQSRLADLAAAPAIHAAVLADKERALVEGGDPRGGQLLALADQRGRLTAELREIAEALAAAVAAWQALRQVRDRLGRASSWSTYDTFLGGGAIVSAGRDPGPTPRPPDPTVTPSPIDTTTGPAPPGGGTQGAPDRIGTTGGRLNATRLPGPTSSAVRHSNQPAATSSGKAVIQ